MRDLKGTLGVIALIIVVFFINTGNLAFNLEWVIVGQWWRALTFPFIHWDLVHLLGSIFSVFFFMGMAETVLGTLKTLIYSLAFAFVPVLFTSVVGAAMLPESLAVTALTESTCGTSFMVYGLAGLMFSALKYKKAVLMILGVPLVFLFLQGNVLSSSLIVSFAMGYYFSKKERGVV